jgi:hypothetical protein
MTEESFHRVISDHLALCERNKRLEQQMPLDHYRVQFGGGSTKAASHAPPPTDDLETKTVANVRKRDQWLDHDSFWDATGERPLPEFDWGDD